MRRLLILFLAVATVSFPSVTSAQPTVQDMEVIGRIDGFCRDMDELISSISPTDGKSLAKIEREFLAMKFRWESYIGVQMALVTDMEAVSKSVAEYETLSQTAEDSIASVKVIIAALSDFETAEKALGKNLSEEYDGMTSDALKYSMTKATASQLEQLKVREQMVFGKAQEQFSKAQAAAELNPRLKKRMAALEENFIDIQNASAKVQAAEYKPIVARIKEYLMSLAAVALILMFFIMVQGKIKALKAARENAKKYKEMLNHEDECPTI